MLAQALGLSPKPVTKRNEKKKKEKKKFFHFRKNLKHDEEKEMQREKQNLKRHQLSSPLYNTFGSLI